MEPNSQDLAPFTAFMAEHRNGQFNAEATVALADVVQRVSETGRAGKVTITIDVSPMKKGQPGHLVVITDRVDGKPPADDRDGALWFVTDGGGVSRRDPRQTSMSELIEEA